jgi:hypothetical protein
VRAMTQVGDKVCCMQEVRPSSSAIMAGPETRKTFRRRPRVRSWIGTSGLVDNGGEVGCVGEPGEFVQ